MIFRSVRSTTRLIMPLTSIPPGILDAPRLAGWISESLAVPPDGIHARYLQHQTAGNASSRMDLFVTGPSRPRASGTRRGRPNRLASAGGDLAGDRRPAHAEPEPGAPLSPGPPLGFRLPSCRGPAPRLRRTSTKTTRHPGGRFTCG